MSLNLINLIKEKNYEVILEYFINKKLIVKEIYSCYYLAFNETSGTERYILSQDINNNIMKLVLEKYSQIFNICDLSINFRSFFDRPEKLLSYLLNEKEFSKDKIDSQLFLSCVAALGNEFKVISLNSNEYDNYMVNLFLRKKISIYKNESFFSYLENCIEEIILKHQYYENLNLAKNICYLLVTTNLIKEEDAIFKILSNYINSFSSNYFNQYSVYRNVFACIPTIFPLSLNGINAGLFALDCSYFIYEIISCSLEKITFLNELSSYVLNSIAYNKYSNLTHDIYNDYINSHIYDVDFDNEILKNILILAGKLSGDKDLAHSFLINFDQNVYCRSICMIYAGIYDCVKKGNSSILEEFLTELERLEHTEKDENIEDLIFLLNIYTNLCKGYNLLKKINDDIEELNNTNIAILKKYLIESLYNKFITTNRDDSCYKLLKFNLKLLDKVFSLQFNNDIILENVLSNFENSYTNFKKLNQINNILIYRDIDEKVKLTPKSYQLCNSYLKTGNNFEIKNLKHFYKKNNSNLSQSDLNYYEEIMIYYNKIDIMNITNELNSDEYYRNDFYYNKVIAMIASSEIIIDTFPNLNSINVNTGYGDYTNYIAALIKSHEVYLHYILEYIYFKDNIKYNQALYKLNNDKLDYSINFIETATIGTCIKFLIEYFEIINYDTYLFKNISTNKYKKHCVYDLWRSNIRNGFLHSHTIDNYVVFDTVRKLTSIFFVCLVNEFINFKLVV